jgi:hypothetical protein
VTLSEVELKPQASTAPLQLFYNAEEKPKTLSLSKEFKDSLETENFVLQGFDSRILRRNH